MKKLLVDKNFMFNMSPSKLPECTNFSFEVQEPGQTKPDMAKPYGYFNKTIPWFYVSEVIEGGFRFE